MGGADVVDRDLARAVPAAAGMRALLDADRVDLARLDRLGLLIMIPNDQQPVGERVGAAVAVDVAGFAPGIGQDLDLVLVAVVVPAGLGFALDAAELE